MISIELTIPGNLISEFLLTKDQIDDLKQYLVHGVTLVIAKSWDTQAKQNLRSSREDYRRSIIISEDGRFKGKISLVGWLANAIEDGIQAFDLKTGILNGKNSKSLKDGSGRYNTVPFRYATPGSIAESSVFSGTLPQEIYEVVKGQSTTNSSTQPLQLNQIPDQYQIPKTREATSGVDMAFAEYKNKTSVYEGLQRVTKFYGSATQGQYVVFRRVSSKSDSNSWIHSGIVAKKLAERAVSAANVDKTVDILTDNFLNSIK